MELEETTEPVGRPLAGTHRAAAPPGAAAREWARGWPAVGGAMLGMASGMSMFIVVSGFFVKPLTTAFGWSRGEVALSAGAVFICSLLLPFAGVLADRFGARRLGLLGAATFAGCYLAFASMSGPLWQYLAILAVIGLVSGPATMPFVFARPVAVAFDRSRGLALGVAMTGFPLLSFALLPTLQHVIATYGWRPAFLGLAPLSLLLGVGSWLLFGRAPKPLATAAEPAGDPEPNVSLREATADPRFWLLALSMAAVNFSVGIFMTTLQPMLSDRGVDGRTAALLGAWQGVATLLGRVCVGALADRLWPPMVGAVALGAPALGLVIFLGAGSELVPIAVGIGLVVFAFGAETDLMGFFSARYFGLRAFAAVAGALAVFAGLTLSAGSMIAGFMFDRFGDYQHVLQIGAALSAVAAASILASGLVRGR